MPRTLYPVPFQAIWDHPDFERLPASGAGMLLRLVEHYWRGDCRGIPAADHELRGVCRAHYAAWKEHKAAILKVFADCRASLDAYHAFRMQRRGQLKIASWSGGAKRSAVAKANRLHESQRASAPTITDFHQLGHVPKREPAPPRPPTPDQRPKRPIRVDTLPRR